MNLAAGACLVIAVAYSEELSAGRIVAPRHPFPWGFCLAMANAAQLTVGPDQALTLPHVPEFTLSEVLPAFVPGRYFIGALILSRFEYEVLALDAVIEN